MSEDDILDALDDVAGPSSMVGLACTETVEPKEPASKKQKTEKPVPATSWDEPLSSKTWCRRLQQALLEHGPQRSQLRELHIQSLCSGMATESFGLQDAGVLHQRVDSRKTQTFPNFMSLPEVPL